MGIDGLPIRLLPGLAPRAIPFLGVSVWRYTPLNTNAIATTLALTLYFIWAESSSNGLTVGLIVNQTNQTKPTDCRGLTIENTVHAAFSIGNY
jgi:hypothetical protein